MSDFLDESSTLIVQLNDSLLELDELLSAANDDQPTRCDEELMNRMFRAAHSIKGLSAMLGLSNINGLTHKIENVFDAAHKEQLHFDSSSVDLVFRSVDRLSEMIDSLKKDGHNNIDASDLASSIKELLSSQSVDARKARGAAMATDEVVSTECQNAESTAGSVTSDLSSAIDVDWFQGLIDDEEVPAQYLAIFIDDSLETLDSINDTLLKVDGLSPAIANESLLVTSHRLKGSAASVGLHRVAKLAHLMEDVFQELRERELAMNTPLVDANFACCDALRSFCEGLRNGSANSSSFNRLAQELVTAKALWDLENPRVGEAQPSSEANLESTSSQAPAAASAESTGTRSYLATVTVNFAPNLPAAGLKASLIVEKLLALGTIEISDPDLEQLSELNSLSEWMFAIRTSHPIAKIRARCEVSGVRKVEFALPPGVGPDGWLAPAPTAAPSTDHSSSPTTSTTATSTPTSSAAPASTSTAKASPSPATASSPRTSSAASAPTTLNQSPPVTPAPGARESKPGTMEPKVQVAGQTVDSCQAEEAPLQAEPAPTSAKTPALEAAGQREGEAAKGEESGKSNESARPNETLRVDIERLDQLMNLAGQLVINKARFTQIGEQLRSSLLSKQTPQLMNEAINLTRQISKTIEGNSMVQSSQLPQLQMQVQRLAADLSQW